MKSVSNTKRLAKNTMFMYLRMIVLVIISLYTSRIILEQLGVTDFGIYNVVGSIVVMFSSLKSMLASSTQRFLNYEMGRKNDAMLKKIFSMSIEINVIASIIFIIIVEVVGIWFLNNKINIPEDRFDAAFIVFQLSVLTVVLGFINSPLDACIIANEKMNYYAYISIIEGCLKLFVCFVLAWSSSDKLILYGILLFIISIIVFFANLIYCKTNFKECIFNWILDKKLFKEMASFAGWAFLGNTAFSLSQSGINLVLNIFGGPIVNTARGISYQVNNVFTNFISNISIVIRPYMIKSYSGGEIQKSFRIVYFSSKLYYYIQLALALVTICFAEQILKIWLGQVPEYTVVFLDLVLVYTVIRSLHGPVDTLFSARGKYKYYQIIEGTVLMLPVVASYFLLEYGLPYYSVFIAVIFFEAFDLFCVLLLARKQCDLNLTEYYKEVVYPCIMGSILAIIGYWCSVHTDALYFKIIIIVVSEIIILFYLYLWGINNTEKSIIHNLIGHKNKV